MAVFVFKIISIAIRTLARPLINWVSYYNRIKVQESKNKSGVLIRNRLVWLGQTINYYNILLNRRIFGLTKDTGTIKALTQDKALERGAELISEIIVYSILLTIPIYEMIKSYKSTVEKERKKKEAIVNMQTDIDCLIEVNLQNRTNIECLSERLRVVNLDLINIYAV